jgi:hypothetical protein
MELEASKPGKQNLLNEEENYDDSNATPEKKKDMEGGNQPSMNSPNKSYEEVDSYEERDNVGPVDSPSQRSCKISLHFVIIYDRVKTTYLSLPVSGEYTEANLDLKNLKKTMVDMKIEKREVYRTTNSPDADWTSIFVKGGLYVSALFDKRVLIGERMKLLLQVKKVIQEVTKTINLATNSRVVKNSTEAITSKCKAFAETLAACGIDSKLDKDKYSKTFEELLEEVDITDITEDGYEQKFPELKEFIDDNLHRFQRLEAWRSGKSKLIVAVFAGLMLLGILGKLLSYLFR